MQVHLLAHTKIELDFQETSTGFNELIDVTENWMETDPDSIDADILAEFAGRACYQSFHKPNPKTAANKDYLANILHQGHNSVLEHASATFYIEGVSRALTHELIRHRHLSYSEMSQRFVNMEDAEMVVPPALRDDFEDLRDDFGDLNIFDEIRSEYNGFVSYLMGVKGLSRKQAREAARTVMPNATETRIVVTGNHRAWRDMLAKRWHVAADAEIREFAGEILRILRKVAPNQFQDFPEKPFE
ncbi:FAD-dependent thymidylate synthase [Saccharopolyspora indica]|uniref:FAD-dependent thymidylate synthase n=1 Tax=Saccharopolyspora indica TaxID=1229659 RepID=UPI0022EB00C5|nr:FAD-dependent thymidylate synthase [Saccharopolyspora indica]MDA3643821.1 FAD-dependent thymidylate synthase [Saccharopolyspora indica]